ncbi:PREDICTED: low affinity immunoglobulin gamma Fc region receptor III-like [Chrysochloris asiatica]|uniref:low affinity immunoglobulin gamma Fc region receptor III-like n=1 Tax=Chrysochloris asiatica TaxID=185453 RepID=UPI0003F15546|nr:PREDICTED: low affinity immunoglobulin gamma Fc region receptor III-like [Chrysochloris asiatica]
MWQLLPPTALLLVVSAGLQADPLKAVVSLDPPWYSVLSEDRVTLKCQGSYKFGDNSTQWWHNGNLISNQTSSYLISAARIEDSGEYRCQTDLTARSDPVQLEVHTGWLLLQAVKSVFQEGDTISLRCNSWRNKTVYKVTYHQNGRSQKYFHQNSIFQILNATHNHSGSYFCRGLIGTLNTSSETINITVQGLEIPSIIQFPPWYEITFNLMMSLLFAVDTGLYFSTQRDLQSTMWRQGNRKARWNQRLQNK